MFSVLDASGNPGPGFFYGNNLWLGSYAQCEDLDNTRRFEINYEVVKHPNSTPYDFPPFQLGFFVAHIQHNSTMQHHSQLPLEVRDSFSFSWTWTLRVGKLWPRFVKVIAEESKVNRFGWFYNAVLCDIMAMQSFII